MWQKKEKAINKLIYRLLNVFAAFVLVLGNSYYAVAALSAYNAGIAVNGHFPSFSNDDWYTTKAPILPIPAANDEVHWTITGLNSVTIDWRGPSNTVRYGVTTAYDVTVSAMTPSPLPFSSAGPFWEAKLTSLQSNTTYHYSIGSDADHTFKTALPKGSSGFIVDVIGDVGDTTSYPNVGLVQGMIAVDQPSLALMVGDLTYGNAHGQAVVDQHFNDVQAWSLGSTAYMPAWGNHEWDSPSSDDLRNYKGRFDFPNPQTSPGSPTVSCCGEDWYYFDYGNTRFIAYPEPWSGAWADWNTRATTLMNEAQADPAITFIVTFGHRPAYSSGHHPGDGTLQSYLDNLGATHSKYVLNLNGHSHNYERTFPQNNVVHITAGMGGSSLEQDGTCLWLTCSQPTWSAKRYMHHGVVRLTFNATSIQGAFICGPAGGGTNDITCTQGDVIDTFTIGNPDNQQMLTVNKNGTGSGTITSFPTGINCGSTCSYSFANNTAVTLMASPTSPSTFGGWSGAGCSGTGSCIVTMSSAQSVTATFNKSGYQTLAVNKNGTGSGTVTSSPTGINCGSTCSYSFANNTVVTLTALSTSSSSFGGWSGAGCSGTGTCIVTTSSAQSVTATFNNNTLPIFADVPFNYWANSWIERLYNDGITGGCSTTPLNYCPDNTVTRAQMAVFLLRGMHGSGFTPPAVGASTGFTDVVTNYWAAAWIKQLAAEGITGGCGAGIYCPDATVTRAQMAVFLLKAKHGSSYSPPAATGVFTDVPVGYWADKWIEQLAVEGVTSGCGAGVYCPDADVTRAQMAVFLVKAFNLP